jgi:hypothetical protein
MTLNTYVANSITGLMKGRTLQELIHLKVWPLQAAEKLVFRVGRGIYPRHKRCDPETMTGFSP